jgi:hypothetical protein
MHGLSIEAASLFIALLHKSDISQLSLKNFNQMIDMTSELFIVDPETT